MADNSSFKPFENSSKKMLFSDSPDENNISSFFQFHEGGVGLVEEEFYFNYTVEISLWQPKSSRSYKMTWGG